MRKALLFFSGPIMIATILTGNVPAAPPLVGAVKITIQDGHPIADGVYVNRYGPFRFLIDTGAQSNQVEASIAEKIGLQPAFRTEMATLTGSAMVPGGRAADVSLGPASASAQEFLLTRLDGVHQLSSRIQGVLGQEFLSRFDYLLDLAGARIVFGGEPAGGRRIAFHLVDGRPAIDTDRGTLVIDSGTGVAVLYAASTGPATGRVMSASGSALVSKARSLRFRVGGRVYSARATLAPRGALQEDGLFPASVFRWVYVSNSGGFVVLGSA